MNTQTSRRRFLVGSTLAAAAVGSPLALTAQTRPAAGAGGSPGARKYKLGLVTYNMGAKWDVPTLIKRCREIGLAAVELRTTHKHGVEPDINKARRAEVRKAFADSGVVIASLGSVCEFHSPDQAVVRKQMETAEQFIELAHDVGAACVKVRPNGLPKEVPVSTTLQQIGRCLGELGPIASAAGVEITCEVHGGGTCEPPHMATIMKAADHPAVGVTWNSNQNDVKNGSVAESFALLRPWFKSVHINELTSSYPYDEFFRLLTASGYDRYTMIEAQPLEAGNDKDAVRFLKLYKACWERMGR